MTCSARVQTFGVHCCYRCNSQTTYLLYRPGCAVKASFRAGGKISQACSERAGESSLMSGQRAAFGMPVGNLWARRGRPVGGARRWTTGRAQLTSYAQISDTGPPSLSPGGSSLQPGLGNAHDWPLLNRPCHPWRVSGPSWSPLPSVSTAHRNGPTAAPLMQGMTMPCWFDRWQSCSPTISKDTGASST